MYILTETQPLLIVHYSQNNHSKVNNTWKGILREYLFICPNKANSVSVNKWAKARTNEQAQVSA